MLFESSHQVEVCFYFIFFHSCLKQTQSSVFVGCTWYFMQLAQKIRSSEIISFLLFFLSDRFVIMVEQIYFFLFVGGRLVGVGRICCRVMFWLVPWDSAGFYMNFVLEERDFGVKIWEVEPDNEVLVAELEAEGVGAFEGKILVDVSQLYVGLR
jgi:hypothetical protein